MPPRRTAALAPQEPPQAQGNRAGGARRRTAVPDADAALSVTQEDGDDAHGTKNAHARGGRGRNSNGRTSVRSAPAVSDGDDDDMSSDDDDDVDVESDPPRPPPRTARGRASASAAATATRSAKAKATPTSKATSATPKSTTKTTAKATPKGKTATRPPPRKASAPKKARAADDSDEGAPEPTGLTDHDSDSDSDSDLSDEGNDFVASSSSDESVDSDDLDDDDFAAGAKRKSTAQARGGRPAPKKAKATPAKGKGTAKGTAKGTPKGRGKGRAVSEDEDDEEIELEEGQTIVGRIHPAPKSGWVPKGQISANTLQFLGHLMYDEYNDRTWFKSHEPWFRKAEQEWRDFVHVLQTKMAEKDTQLPIVPARDLCHRIYRDVRFSSDKSPYKANFGMSTSRTGRKGIWAGYHLYLCPGEVFFACGVWQPEKDILQRMRARFMSPGGAAPLRNVISSPAFEAMFGKAKPHPQGRRQNIFGHSDQLKVAPKGVDKTHEQIDLLKLRSITVSKRFTDAEVLAADFADKVAHVVGVMAPFIHVLNTYIAPVHDVVDDSDSDLSGIEVVEP